MINYSEMMSMKLVSSKLMAEIDRRAREEFSIPETVLMEDAALKAQQLLKSRVWNGFPSGPVVFAVGRGNNGGDALVMARHCLLEGKKEISIVLASGPPRPGSSPGINLNICNALGIEIIDGDSTKAFKRINQASWIVDGLLGTGLSGAVRAPVDRLIARINASKAHTVAVDIPSGVGDAFRKGYPAVQADVTLTIALPKLCLYLPHTRRFCGEILTVSGVFPPQLVEDRAIPGSLLQEEALSALYRPLPADTYKTRRGHLAVFAGGVGTTGAAFLAATAAGRSRTGLVTLFMDEALYPADISRFNSVMVRPIIRGSKLELDRFSGLLVGPGWGLSADRKTVLEGLIELSLPGVLDADGLTMLAELSGQKRIDLGGRWVLTPHPGEFARLVGRNSVLDDPLPALLELSRELNAMVVLKGHCSFIAGPDGKYALLDGMNPALATGGSGDVLSGIIAGLLASGLEAERAAKLGVLIHDRIGWAAYQELGFFLAEDLLPYISCKFGELQG